jgi:hypothetical protein
MKKILFLSIPALLIVFFSIKTMDTIWSQNKDASGQEPVTELKKGADYKFPDFYKGIYLTSESGKNLKKLTYFITRAKEAGMNTLVIDIQDSRYKECIIPKEYVDLCFKNGLHPIARLVVFPDGLKKYPVAPSAIQEKLALAESACKNGFREIQFDYIRFNDYGIIRHLTYQERYDFIEGFLGKAREHLKKYDVKIAADIFGRIPLNSRDEIGQRMEGLDRVVDIICPMAYPSHYTWSTKLMADPYHTVYITSKKAKERVKAAEIVTYIQAFKMKLGISKLSYQDYVAVQIKAVHDAGIRGYLMWNARQDYDVPLAAVKSYYSRTAKNITRSETADKAGRSSM